jgi:hypothetical protein
MPVRDGAEFPRAVLGVLKARTQAEPRERRRKMRGIAGQEDTPVAEALRYARLEPVDAGAQKVKVLATRPVRHQCPYLFRAPKPVAILTGQQHEVPAMRAARKGTTVGRAGSQMNRNGAPRMSPGPLTSTTSQRRRDVKPRSRMPRRRRTVPRAPSHPISHRPRTSCVRPLPTSRALTRT